MIVKIFLNIDVFFIIWKMLTSTFLKPTHKPFLRVPSHVLYVTLPVLGAFLQVYLRCCVQWLLFSTKAYKKLTRVKHKLSTMYRHVKKIKGWIFCLHKAINNQPVSVLWKCLAHNRFENIWLLENPLAGHMCSWSSLRQGKHEFQNKYM